MTRRFQVPDPEADFVDQYNEGVEFLPADDVQELGDRVLATNQRFSKIRASEPEVVYLWKKAGGASGGRNTLGMCSKASGLVKHFGQVDFVIWLAADHCQNLDDSQIEAVLYHELCHIGVNSKTGAFVITPHDWEGFSDEIREYGANVVGIHGIGRAVQSSFIKEA